MAHITKKRKIENVEFISFYVDVRAIFQLVRGFEQGCKNIDYVLSENKKPVILITQNLPKSMYSVYIGLTWLFAVLGLTEHYNCIYSAKEIQDLTTENKCGALPIGKRKGKNQQVSPYDTVSLSQARDWIEKIPKEKIDPIFKKRVLEFLYSLSKEDSTAWMDLKEWDASYLNWKVKRVAILQQLGFDPVPFLPEREPRQKKAAVKGKQTGTSTKSAAREEESVGGHSAEGPQLMSLSSHSECQKCDQREVDVRNLTIQVAVLQDLVLELKAAVGLLLPNKAHGDTKEQVAIEGNPKRQEVQVVIEKRSDGDCCVEIKSNKCTFQAESDPKPFVGWTFDRFNAALNKLGREEIEHICPAPLGKTTLDMQWFSKGGVSLGDKLHDDLWEFLRGMFPDAPHYHFCDVIFPKTLHLLMVKCEGIEPAAATEFIEEGWAKFVNTDNMFPGPSKEEVEFEEIYAEN
eukprot:Colp12_sorted_trinity150504_noHs@10271